MSLIATEPVRRESLPDDGGEKVDSGAFWPVVLLSDIRRVMKLDGTVTTDRLKSKTIEAVAHVNHRLRAFRLAQQASGIETLAAVPCEEINGESVNLWRYKTAVYSQAKALLIEGYRDIDTTRDGEKHAEALATQIDTLWRDVNWAISDILNAPRAMIELV